MDPTMLGIIYVLGGLSGLGLLCFVCSKPLKKLDEEILYGEGCLNKYCGCCISVPEIFKPRNVVTNIPDSKEMEGRV